MPSVQQVAKQYQPLRCNRILYYLCLDLSDILLLLKDDSVFNQGKPPLHPRPSSLGIAVVLFGGIKSQNLIDRGEVWTTDLLIRTVVLF